MDALWKLIMRLNARAVFLLTLALFLGVAGWCWFSYHTPPQPFQEGSGSAQSEFSDAWHLDMLEFVSNQLDGTSISVPFNPFRPTIEAILTNETERAAFLKALKEAQEAVAGGKGGARNGAKKEDPFAHLRKKEVVPGAKVGPDGRPLITPKISFLGFMKRTDGSSAAVFHDSSDNSNLFYEPGGKVHGVEMLSADVRTAEVRMPDGTQRTLNIGETLTLEPEPDKRPPKKLHPKKGTKKKPPVR